jgi:streptogrisin C
MFIKRAAIAAVACAAVCAATAGTASAAAGEPTEDDIAATHRSVHPEMSIAAANRAAAQADERKLLYDELTGAGLATYGGAWFDPPSGVLHVAVTTTSAAERVAARGDGLGLDVKTHLVGRTFASLERQADALRSADDALGRAAGGQVGIDVETNQVVAAVPAAQRTALVPAARAAGVRLVADPDLDVRNDACTARDACDSEIRAGATVWRSFAGNDVCSAGFTAGDPWGNRWLFTAGHCSSGNGVTWGTGAQSIGPMWGSYDGGNVDTALIQVTNPLYTNDLGGDLYKTLDVDDVAPTVSYIVSGETVCLAANITNPTDPFNHCGEIASNSDWLHRGMVHVDGEDACNGDSGGGWYWSVNGFRTAYGIHSASDPTCHGTGSNDDSWFTAIALADLLLNPMLVVEER